MTTLYGALLGRALRAPVAHIESGLRSFDLLHPFPEELNRRLTSRIATICYAPGAWATANLRHGQVVDTGSNTIRDALAMVEPEMPVPLELPDEPFGIVSLHRFELLNDRRLFTQALEALSASSWPLLFVDHPVTVAAVERFGLEHHFEGGITSGPAARLLRVCRDDAEKLVPRDRQRGKPGGELLPRPSVSRAPLSARSVSKGSERPLCSRATHSTSCSRSSPIRHASADEASSRPSRRLT